MLRAGLEHVRLIKLQEVGGAAPVNVEYQYLAYSLHDRMATAW
jgi:hypothetical protein